MSIRIECELMVTTEQDEVINLHYCCSMADPAIAHLVDLLQTELRSPQPMGQLAISSIVTVLLTHLLHQPAHTKRL
jgi:hypothetical protein